jgi:hypothetical protein
MIRVILFCSFLNLAQETTVECVDAVIGVKVAVATVVWLILIILPQISLAIVGAVWL